MKERVGDEKLIIIGAAVRDINDHIRFYSQRLMLFIKYCNLLQNRHNPFTAEIIYINLSCLLLRTQHRSIAQQLWQSFTTSILPLLNSCMQRRLKVKFKECRSALPN